ncbi:MAG: hypothetical protein AAF708_14305 [Deinococcota bacterium]
MLDSIREIGAAFWTLASGFLAIVIGVFPLVIEVRKTDSDVKWGFWLLLAFGFSIISFALGMMLQQNISSASQLRLEVARENETLQKIAIQDELNDAQQEIARLRLQLSPSQELLNFDGAWRLSEFECTYLPHNEETDTNFTCSFSVYNPLEGGTIGIRITPAHPTYFTSKGITYQAISVIVGNSQSDALLDAYVNSGRKIPVQLFFGNVEENIDFITNLSISLASGTSDESATATNVPVYSAR